MPQGYTNDKRKLMHNKMTARLKFSYKNNKASNFIWDDSDAARHSIEHKRFNIYCC